MDEARCVLVAERRERDRGAVRLAAAPGGPAREELWARSADDEHGDVREPVDQVVDEVEQAVVGPVQVLEDEHERPLLAERLEEPPPGGEGLSSAIAARLLCGQADERAEVGLEPRRLRLVRHDPLDRLAQLARRLLRRIRFEDAGLGLDHLSERPVAHTLAVGQRAALAPPDETIAAVDGAEELAEEAALPDAGHADDAHELGHAIVGGPPEAGEQQLQLLVAADERRRGRRGEVDAEPRPRLYRLPDAHRLDLPLRLHRLVLAVLDRAP